MKELIEKLREQLENLRAAFGRLSQRDQFAVLGAALAALLAILVGVGFAVSSAIDTAERRVRTNTEILAEVLAAQDDYKAREAQRQARLKEIGRTQTRLTSVIEDVARQTGVEIGQLRPEDGEPGPDGIFESRVDLKAQNLSADRLQDFLSRLETSPGVIIMRRLKVVRPYRKDVLEIEMSVATYRLKS